jgi:uncharacterized protein (TIGR00645 family)
MTSETGSPASRTARLEGALEGLLFGTRWLLAPFYLGLALGLVLLLCKFALSTVDLILHGLQADQDHLIVAVLGLVDISLMANLVLMVMFAGYENFVSRLDLHNHPDRPTWMGHVGFGELKLKLMTSIVAISAIHVLEDFMNAPGLLDRDLAWRAGLHLLFIVSGVLLALMDRISRGSTGEGH